MRSSFPLYVHASSHSTLFSNWFLIEFSISIFFRFRFLALPTVEYACNNRGRLNLIINSHPFNRSSAHGSTIYWNCIHYNKTRYARHTIFNITWFSVSSHDIIIFSNKPFPDAQHASDPIPQHCKLTSWISNITIDYKQNEATARRREMELDLNCRKNHAWILRLYQIELTTLP